MYLGISDLKFNMILLINETIWIVFILSEELVNTVRKCLCNYLE